MKKLGLGSTERRKIHRLLEYYSCVISMELISILHWLYLHIIHYISMSKQIFIFPQLFCHLNQKNYPPKGRHFFLHFVHREHRES